ncbi:Protein of unknown function [Gryllus bimaculatus]|nr:Protein of unknown function [Gryllus bimaculatus]
MVGFHRDFSCVLLASTLALAAGGFRSFDTCKILTIEFKLTTFDKLDKAELTASRSSSEDSSKYWPKSTYFEGDKTTQICDLTEGNIVPPPCIGARFNSALYGPDATGLPSLKQCCACRKVYVEAAPKPKKHAGRNNRDGIMACNRYSQQENLSMGLHVYKG